MSRLRLGSLLHYLLRRVRPSHSGEVGDADLLERFTSAKDEAAFELLVWRHGPMVLGLCQRLLRHEQDAEDAFQATFMILARKARSIGRREALASWLYKVAYRVACRARRLVPATLNTDLLPAPEEQADVIWRDLRAVLDQELARLPESYRRPVVLCYLEGKTHEEAAQLLGWPKGTVATRLARAKDRLRTTLGRRGLAVSSSVMAFTLSEKVLAGPVRAELVRTTLQSASAYASGKAVAGVVSTTAIALSEGVLRIMWLNKLKVMACGFLAVAVCATGIGLGLREALAAGGAQPGARAQGEPPPNPQAKSNKALMSQLSEMAKMQLEIKNLRKELDEALRDIRELRAARQGPVAADPGPLYRGRPVRSWLEQAKDGDPTYRKDAIVALGALAGQNKSLVAELAPVLIAALQEKNPDVNNAAKFAVSGLGNEIVPLLVNVITDKTSNDTQTRSRALYALSFQGQAAKDALPLLMQTIKEADVEIRWTTLVALGGIGPDAKVALPLITSALKDESETVREHTVYTLASIGPDAKPAIPELMALLGRRMDEIQKRSAQAKEGAPKKGVFPGGSGPRSPVYLERFESPLIIIDALVKIDPTIREVVPEEYYTHPQSDRGRGIYADWAGWQRIHDALKQRYGPMGK